MIKFHFLRLLALFSPSYTICIYNDKNSFTENSFIQLPFPMDGFFTEYVHFYTFCFLKGFTFQNKDEYMHFAFYASYAFCFFFHFLKLVAEIAIRFLQSPLCIF